MSLTSFYLQPPTSEFFILIYPCIYFFTSIQVWFSSSVVEAVLKMNLSGREPPFPEKELMHHSRCKGWYPRSLPIGAGTPGTVNTSCDQYMWGQIQCPAWKSIPMFVGTTMIFQGSAQLRTSMGVSWWKDYFSFFQVVFLTSRTMSGAQQTVNGWINKISRSSGNPVFPLEPS